MAISDFFSRFRKATPAPAVAARIRAFNEKGYVIIQQAIEHRLIDTFWTEVQQQVAENPALTLSVYGKIFRNAERNMAEVAAGRTTLRIIDIERHSKLASALFLHPACAEFLTALYGGVRPTAIQTLTYEFSSEQRAHSDKFLVSPPTVGPVYDRESLAASWIACEDADEHNGALVIYPGSHRI